MSDLSDDRFYALVAEVLGRSAGPSDGFFDLGGDSLTAAKLVTRLRRRHGADVQLADIFEHPQLDELFAAIRPGEPGKAATASPAVPQPDTRAPSPDGWWAVNANQAARLGRVKAQTMETEAGWSTTSHLITVGFRVAGPLDLDRLRTAVRVVTDRHDALRTRFRWSPEPRQQVTGHPVELVIVEDADECRPPLVSEPFDLAAGPMARFVLVRHGAADDDHADLWLSVEHLVADGWSIELLLTELSQAYVDPEQVPRRPVVQNHEFAAHEEEFCRSPRGTEAEAYWLRTLSGGSPWLGFDYPGWRKPSPQARARTVWHEATLTAADAQRLSTVCRNHAVTPFMIVLAALAAAVNRRTGLTTIPALAPILNRWDADFESTVTFAASVSPVPVEFVPAAKASERLRLVQAVVTKAITHAPFGTHRYTRLHAPQDWGQPQRRPYLYLDVSPRTGPSLDFAGTTVTPLPQPEATIILGVAIWVTYDANGITIRIGHPCEFLPDAELEKLAAELVASLQELLALESR